MNSKFAKIDLSKLSEISTKEKTFLSVYLSGARSLKFLEKRFREIRRVLDGSDSEKDERAHFEENAAVIQKYLEENPLDSGSLCIFSGRALDFFQVHRLSASVDDLVWFDSSLYIRPLAELQDEYENVAVVIADNKKARVFLISSAVPGPDASVLGNIKNHVRKGGWSQQRYERRRDKQLLAYAREIAGELETLRKTDNFRRIILVGGKEILQILQKELPAHLQKMAVQKAIDLRKGDVVVNKEIMDLFFEQERQSEQELWEKIRSEYLRGGLGVVGVDNVLQAVESGKAGEIIVNRDFRPIGSRCRVCENLETKTEGVCSKCGSDSVFEVGLVNEIVELAKLTGADVDFCDTIKSLENTGGIAAFLRYI